MDLEPGTLMHGRIGTPKARLSARPVAQRTPFCCRSNRQNIAWPILPRLIPLFEPAHFRVGFGADHGNRRSSIDWDGPMDFKRS